MQTTPNNTTKSNLFLNSRNIRANIVLKTKKNKQKSTRLFKRRHNNPLLHHHICIVFIVPIWCCFVQIHTRHLNLLDICNAFFSFHRVCLYISVYFDLILLFFLFSFDSDFKQKTTKCKNSHQPSSCQAICVHIYFYTHLCQLNNGILQYPPSPLFHLLLHFFFSIKYRLADYRDDLLGRNTSASASSSSRHLLN